MAVAKVEELTRQLEEVKRGRAPPRAQPPAALELDKLRKELMVRNTFILFGILQNDLLRPIYL